MRNRTIALVLLGFIFFIAFAGVIGCTAPNTPQPVATPTVQTKIISPTTVRAEGVIVPAQHTTLAFKISGRIVEIPVHEGDTVKAGAIIARLDDTTLKAQVAQAEAAYAAAQTQAERARAANAAQIQIAAAQLARLKAGPTAEEIAVAEGRVQEAATALARAQESYDRLRWIGGPTEADVRFKRDQAAAAYATAQADLARIKAGARPEEIAVAEAQLDLAQGEAGKAEIQAAQAQVDQAKAALELAKTSLQDVLLVAPFDGTVALVGVDMAQVVPPGTPAISFGDLSKLLVETTDLTEVNIAQVVVGQKVNVKVDAFPGETFQGQVLRIAQVATDHLGDKVYKVTIELQDGVEAGLRWGMTANVEIIVGQ